MSVRTNHLDHLTIDASQDVARSVDNNLIEFLYNTSKSLDNSSIQYIRGRLEILHGYKDACDFLTGKFHDLTIISTQGYYIRFEDPVVGQALIDSQGDGEGLTYNKAALISQSNILKNLFQGNKQITKFNELKEFISMTYMQYECFKECSNLEEIDLTNITNLDSTCFYKCSKLKSIGNYSNLQSISDSTFDYCDLTGDFDFSHITISNSYNQDRHKPGGFRNNPHLTSIVMMNNVKSLCSFYGCSSLTSISNVDSVTNIPQDCFIGCDKLKTVSFPSCTSVLVSAFRTTKVESISFASLQQLNYDNSFQNCKSLTQINMPELITISGSYMFAGDTALTIVQFPKLQTISGGSTFAGDTALTTVNLPSCTSISGALIFYNCSNLETITLSENNNITIIPAECFRGCSNLTSISNLNYGNLTIINSHGFRDCVKLFENTAVLEFTNLITLNEAGFYNCKAQHVKFPALINGLKNLAGLKATRIDLNPNITEIPAYCFDGNSTIQTVTGLSNVTKVNYESFYNNTALTSLDFTNKLVNIGELAFAGCTQLSVICSNGDILKPVSIGSSAFNGTLITKIDLSECTSLSNGACMQTSSLVNIGSLNNTLTEIPSWCFAYSGITNIDIPASVTMLRDACFYGCSSLISITFHSTTVPSRDDVRQFAGCHANLKIYVPMESVETYKSTWSNWSSIIEGKNL